jgi:hypothetical protein
MKKTFILFAAFLVFFLSCAGSIRYSQEQFSTVQNKINTQEIAFSGGDGSTFDNAIIITGVKNDTDLYVAELLLVSNRIGIMGKDWKLIGQYPINKDGFYFAFGKIDLVDIKTLKDNHYKSFYFNKSSLIDENDNHKQRQIIQEMMILNKVVLDKISNHDITFSGGDGLSFETAIIIKGIQNNQEGINAEYIYISNKHGKVNINWKPIMQALIDDTYKYCDNIQIEDINNNTKISYYFDITAVKDFIRNKIDKMD